MMLLLNMACKNKTSPLRECK